MCGLRGGLSGWCTKWVGREGRVCVREICVSEQLMAFLPHLTYHKPESNSLFPTAGIRSAGVPLPSMLRSVSIETLTTVLCHDWCSKKGHSILNLFPPWQSRATQITHLFIPLSKCISFPLSSLPLVHSVLWRSSWWADGCL